VADLKTPSAGFKTDLLGQPLPKITTTKDKITFALNPGACFCLAPTPLPLGLSGDDYRRARAQAAWAVEALSKVVTSEIIDGFDWRWLADAVKESPQTFLAAVSQLAASKTKKLP